MRVFLEELNILIGEWDNTDGPLQYKYIPPT
jgi:hypothetical protein